MLLYYCTSTFDARYEGYPYRQDIRKGSFVARYEASRRTWKYLAYPRRGLSEPSPHFTFLAGAALTDRLNPRFS